MRAYRGLPLLFCVLALGCQRKLPGPVECREFVLTSLGIEPTTPATALSRQPQLTARAEELTRQCLTTPWDYQLMSCLQQGQGNRACLMSFDERRGAGTRQVSPTWR